MTKPLSTRHSSSRASRKGWIKTVQRAQHLVDLFLTAMEEGVREDHVSETWVRNFGSKESAVSNLQKLVGVIGLLTKAAEGPESAAATESTSMMPPEDFALLKQWLADAEHQASHSSKIAP